MLEVMGGKSKYIALGGQKFFSIEITKKLLFQNLGGRGKNIPRTPN